jgi:glycosyltransferase involved in cell wall biosynthesis
MGKPRVSVIMLTYNRPQHISRAIESVVSQRFQDWRLIVVHDGPNEQISAVLSEWQKRESRVLYFRRAKGGNIANATNFGIQQAEGDYVAILDDDDFWPAEDKLSRQVKFLDEHPEYAGCGGGLIAIDERGQATGRCYKAFDDKEIRRIALMANPMAHSTGMYRRALIEKIGGYDESLAGFQDWDVWLKLGKLGKLCNFPEYWLMYQMWPGSGSFSQQKANSRCALRIVARHRRDYPRFATALTMATAYHLYAHLPENLRGASFDFLSRLKKTVFSPKPVNGAS